MDIRDIFLASQRSERDTLLCNAIEISLYLIIGERARRARHYQESTNSSWCVYIYLITLIPTNVTSQLQCISASATGMNTIPVTNE